MTAVAPDVELSVYGSGSFKTGVAIGDAGYSDEKGYTRLMLSGAQSEMSFHDRNEVACKADKRWNLYASEKKLRTHRPGGKGGFVISEDMTRFLQVSHAILSPSWLPQFLCGILPLSGPCLPEAAVRFRQHSTSF